MAGAGAAAGVLLAPIAAPVMLGAVGFGSSGIIAGMLPQFLLFSKGKLTTWIMTRARVYCCRLPGWCRPNCGWVAFRWRSEHSCWRSHPPCRIRRVWGCWCSWRDWGVFRHNIFGEKRRVDSRDEPTLNRYRPRMNWLLRFASPKNTLLGSEVNFPLCRSSCENKKYTMTTKIYF